MRQSTDKTDDRIYAADGRSHFVHYVTDENGNKVATVTGPLKVEFRMQDLAQLVAGACVMAMPVSLTEEVWNLGACMGTFLTNLNKIGIDGLFFKRFHRDKSRK